MEKNLIENVTRTISLRYGHLHTQRRGIFRSKRCVGLFVFLVIYFVCCVFYRLFSCLCLFFFSLVRFSSFVSLLFSHSFRSFRLSLSYFFLSYASSVSLSSSLIPFPLFVSLSLLFLDSFPSLYLSPLLSFLPLSLSNSPLPSFLTVPPSLYSSLIPFVPSVCLHFSYFLRSLCLSSLP